MESNDAENYYGLIAIIEADVKRTVGYSEAKSKELFMIAANVGIVKAEEHFSKEIKQLKYNENYYKTMYESVNDEIKTLSRIIIKHSDIET